MNAHPDKLQQSIFFDKAEPADVAVTFVRDRQCRGAGDNDVGLGESYFLAQNHLQRFFKSVDHDGAGVHVAYVHGPRRDL